MTNNKFAWLLVYDTGETQFINAQTVTQILDSEFLIKKSISIINITRMGLANNYKFQNAD